MNDSEKTCLHSRSIVRYVWLLAVVWTVVVAASLAWNVVQLRRNTLKAARIQAWVAFERDLIYRRWNAEHGGVYAPLTERTLPNPYLDVPERDIMTPLGRKLTLINPAYMTRQVFELMEEHNGVRGHITSLNPIRPQNVPDPWETEALQAFEQGKTEVSSVEKMEGEEYMRLMRPLITEKGCLKCHAAQGYEEGDIRGGISVSVPMEPLLAISHMPVFTLMLGHVLLWLMGLIGIVLGTRRLKRSEMERKGAAEALEKYRDHLEEMVEDRTAELTITKEEAETANRAKSEFLTNMSHELRTPLNSVIALSNILIEQAKDKLSEEENSYLEIVERNGKRLLSLINDILDLSKIGAGKIDLLLEFISVGAILQIIKENLQSLSEQKGLVLTLSVPEKLPKVESDESRLNLIFSNVIGNAVKFTNKGSVDISLKHDSENVFIEVKDTGIGISKEMLPTIFDEFKQADGSVTRQYGGTGLGLAISKKLTTILGGDIKVKSELNKGTVFTVTIPIKWSGEKQ